MEKGDNVKILIVDDDLIFGKMLENIINKKFSDKKNEIVVVKSISDIDMKQKYDYYFIDILLEGENGINFGKTIISKNYFAKIIYMSSENSLVFDTFTSKVYFFLRKSNLKEDLERLWLKIEQDSIKNTDYIEVIVERQRQMILKKNIIYIESNRNKCKIYMRDDNIYEVYRTLKSFLGELDINKYFRLNNYTIINLEYVKNVKGKKITLINDTVFVLKRNYDDFIDAYHNNFMKRFKQ